MSGLLENPQQLIDDGTILNFVGGTAVLVNGWAAGRSWYLVEWKTGTHAGRTMWLADEGETPGRILVYHAQSDDDGFLFNYDPDVVPEDEVCPVDGGGHYPTLEGSVFSLEGLG